ncbi:MAG: YlxR family protein [Bacillus subtilis]|nr:YlxR family protein [Bacillus subtilis]
MKRNSCSASSVQPEGVVAVDLTGRANGRGAYVSKDLAAIEKARKTKILERHLEIGDSRRRSTTT